MPIHAIIFDFGGVLMRTHDYSGRRKWEARLGLPSGGLEKIIFASEVAVRSMLGELPPDAAWQHLAGLFHLDAAQLEEVQRDFWSGDRIDEALVDFVAGLRPRYRTALLSNAWANARPLFTERFGLDRAFELMVISAEEGIAKPDPRIYRRTLERLGVRPEEAVFVDDYLPNVEAARALGIAAVRFESPEQAMRDVRRYLGDGSSPILIQE